MFSTVSKVKNISESKFARKTKTWDLEGLNVNIAESIEHTKLKLSNSVEMKLKFNSTKN